MRGVFLQLINCIGVYVAWLYDEYKNFPVYLQQLHLINIEIWHMIGKISGKFFLLYIK